MIYSVETRCTLSCLLLWSVSCPKSPFASGEKSVNRSPKPDTNNRAQRDESSGVLWENKTIWVYMSRCQGCKCISHRGLFIFVCQTQISTHGWGDLLNKSTLKILWVNRHANNRVFWQNRHGNTRSCQQIPTRVVPLASQSWQQCCCCCCWRHMDGLYPPKGFSSDFTAEQSQSLEALKSIL